MHELKIAEDLSRIVLEEAGNNHLTIVSAVNICFGEMIQIVPAIFETAFRECVRESIASNAVLNIEIIKIRIKCSQCGTELETGKSNFRCIVCDSDKVEIMNGNELYIKSIEGE